MGTIRKTFSIDEKIHERFEKICIEKDMNYDQVFKECINKFIIENFYIDENLKYIIKNDPDYDMISIQKKDGDKVYLSNGNVINIFDFEKMYERIEKEVSNTLNYFEKEKKKEKEIQDSHTKPSNPFFEINCGVTDEVFEEMKTAGAKWDTDNILDQFNQTSSLNPDDFLDIVNIDETSSKNDSYIIEKLKLNSEKIQTELLTSKSWNVTKIFDIGYDITRTEFKFYVFGDVSNVIKKHLNTEFEKIVPNFIFISDFQRTNTMVKNRFKSHITEITEEILINENKRNMFLEYFLNQIFETKEINVSPQGTIVAINIPSRFLLLPELYDIFEKLNIERYMFVTDDLKNDSGIKKYQTLNEIQNNVLPQEKAYVEKYETHEEKVDKLREKYKEKFIDTILDPINIEDNVIDDIEDIQNYLPTHSYSLEDGASEKIIKKLKNINSNAHDLTRIFNMPHLTFIRNTSSLYIYHNPSIKLKSTMEIAKLIEPLVKDIDITSLYFIEQSDITYIPVKNDRLIKLDPKINGFYLGKDFDLVEKLSGIISDTFNDKCVVELFLGTYHIYLHMKYFYSPELYRILESVGIKDNYKLMGNGMKASEIIGNSYHQNNFSDIISIGKITESNDNDLVVKTEIKN